MLVHQEGVIWLKHEGDYKVKRIESRNFYKVE